MTEKDQHLGKDEEVESCFNPSCCSDGRNIYLHRNFDYVWCQSCGVRGPVCDGHPEDAISDWNGISRNVS